MRVTLCTRWTHHLYKIETAPVYSFRTQNWIFKWSTNVLKFPLPKEALLHCWREGKLVQPLWKTACRFPRKLKKKKRVTVWSSNTFLGISPDKALVWKDTRLPMSTAALFTIAKTWKQPKCPSTCEWVKKMWCIYTQCNMTQPWKRAKQGHLQLQGHLQDGPGDDQTKWSKSDRERQHHVISLICGI